MQDLSALPILLLRKLWNLFFVSCWNYCYYLSECWPNQQNQYFSITVKIKNLQYQGDTNLLLGNPSWNPWRGCSPIGNLRMAMPNIFARIVGPRKNVLLRARPFLPVLWGFASFSGALIIIRNLELCRLFQAWNKRHTFATRIVEAGVDLYTVQKLGGWRSISMVTPYARHYTESLRAGVEVPDRVDRKISTNLEQRSKSEVTASL